MTIKRGTSRGDMIEDRCSKQQQSDMARWEIRLRMKWKFVAGKISCKWMEDCPARSSVCCKSSVIDFYIGCKRTPLLISNMGFWRQFSCWKGQCLQGGAHWCLLLYNFHYRYLSTNPIPLLLTSPQMVPMDCGISAHPPWFRWLRGCFSYERGMGNSSLKFCLSNWVDRACPPTISLGALQGTVPFPGFMHGFTLLSQDGQGSKVALYFTSMGCGCWSIHGK